MQQACAVWEGRKQATVRMEKEQGFQTDLKILQVVNSSPPKTWRQF